MGDDLEIVEDARTSIRKPGSSKSPRNPIRDLKEKDFQRIDDFMLYRHASTLRGCIIKVEIETTIAMQRQIRTHWVGNRQMWPDVNLSEWFWEESDLLGFNDQSGKYSKYKPVFYIPSFEDMRIETKPFDPMSPTYERIHSVEEYLNYADAMTKNYDVAWNTYENLLNKGLSREIARFALPEGIFVAGRLTMNLNAAFGMLSKRIDNPDNKTVTHPQLEIQQIAEQIEDIIKGIWPAAHASWVRNGRSNP